MCRGERRRGNKQGRKEKGRCCGRGKADREGGRRKAKAFPPWSQPCRDLTPPGHSPPLTSPAPGGLPWDAEPAKPRSSPSEAPLTAGCGSHTSPGSRTSLSSQSLDTGPVGPRREPYGPHSGYRAWQPCLVWSLVNISAWQGIRGLS